MKKQKRKIVESGAGGHIDVAYGIYDRPGPDITSEELPDVEPIVPSEQVAVQLSVDRPPVDDPDFAPIDKRSLETAMSTLAAYVPDDQIQKLYRLVRDKIESMVDDELMSTERTGEEVMENRVRKMLSETFSDKELERMQADFDEEFGKPDDLDEPAPVDYGDASLEQIAAHSGFSGPSGVKNFLYRLLSRMARFENIPGDELDALIDFAAGEYVDVLRRADLIDDEDAEYMSQNKTIVSELPSFRFFIGTAIASPALKELERTARKKADTFLDKLGISDKTKNTLMNQLMGQVPRNDDLVASRVDDDVKRGLISSEDAAAAKQKMSAGFDAMKKMIMSGDDFVEVALQRYSRLSKAKLLDIVKRASEDPYVAEKM